MTVAGCIVGSCCIGLWLIVSLRFCGDSGWLYCWVMLYWAVVTSGWLCHLLFLCKLNNLTGSLLLSLS